MTLEWIDPPRDYRDEAADIARQLETAPGTWARIDNDVAAYAYDGGNHLIAAELESQGIETRFSRTHGLRGTYGETGDLYARAPKSGV